MPVKALKAGKIVVKKKNQIKVLDEKIKVLSDKYGRKTKTLTSIYDKKVNYRLKSGTYHVIAEELGQMWDGGPRCRTGSLWAD